MRWLIPLWLVASIPALADTAPGPTAHGQPTPGPTTPGADRQAVIGHMLDALKTVPSEDAAGPLEAQITDMWLKSSSPAVSLLMMRGLRELKAQTPQDAVEDLDAAITLDPDFAEAYDQRAIARFQAGDTPGAIADLQEALKRQPRDFGAFRTLAGIAESRGDWKSAYAAWQKLLDIDPKTPGGADKLKDLRRRALGEET